MPYQRCGAAHRLLKHCTTDNTCVLLGVNATGRPMPTMLAMSVGLRTFPFMVFHHLRKASSPNYCPGFSRCCLLKEWHWQATRDASHPWASSLTVLFAPAESATCRLPCHGPMRQFFVFNVKVLFLFQSEDKQIQSHSLGPVLPGTHCCILPHSFCLPFVPLDLFRLQHS